MSARILAHANFSRKWWYQLTLRSMDTCIPNSRNRQSSGLRYRSNLGFTDEAVQYHLYIKHRASISLCCSSSNIHVNDLDVPPAPRTAALNWARELVAKPLARWPLIMDTRDSILTGCMSTVLCRTRHSRMTLVDAVGCQKVGRLGGDVGEDSPQGTSRRRLLLEIGSQ